MSQPLRNTVAEPRETRALAKLTLGGYSWLLPQTEIRSLESLLDIDQEVQAPRSIGAIALGGEWWPVYCLSSELRLLPQLPDNRRICALLDNGADRFGLLCDQVETLAKAPRLLALPACMGSPDSPVQALAPLDEGLGCVTDTEHLAALLAALAEDAGGHH
ncbi:MAG: chemotaxis protein CheW [Candidatus Competibacteraceae bacterium]|nr:MAG: chemotaxis protein CheW [Candidatus Competibacteraceae bacterium]